MTLALPKIQQPTFSVELPSCKEEIIIQPFVSKEEKLLLMANLSEDPSDYLKATKQIVQNCVVEWCSSYSDASKLPLIDLEYVILQLRIVSISDVVTIAFGGIKNSDCEECQKDISIDIDLKEVKVEYQENFDLKVFLEEKTGVILKYLNVKDQEKILKQSKKINSEKNNSEQEKLDVLIDNVFTSMAYTIDSIFTEDDIQKVEDDAIPMVKEWLENLPRHAYEKIEKRISEYPMLKHKIEIKCSKCEKIQEYNFEGLESFFV